MASVRLDTADPELLNNKSSNISDSSASFTVVVVIANIGCAFFMSRYYINTSGTVNFGEFGIGAFLRLVSLRKLIGKTVNKLNRKLLIKAGLIITMHFVVGLFFVDKVFRCYVGGVKLCFIQA